MAVLMSQASIALAARCDQVLRGREHDAAFYLFSLILPSLSFYLRVTALPAEKKKATKAHTRRVRTFRFPHTISRRTPSSPLSSLSSVAGARFTSWRRLPCQRSLHAAKRLPEKRGRSVQSGEPHTSEGRVIARRGGWEPHRVRSSHGG